MIYMFRNYVDFLKLMVNDENVWLKNKTNTCKKTKDGVYMCAMLNLGRHNKHTCTCSV
jgi:hypothetical protein